MNKRRLFPIVVALLLAVLTVSAQDDSPRQMLEQAEEAYQIDSKKIRITHQRLITRPALLI